MEDVNPMRLKAISHFFEHYKDLEEGKWVKVLGWGIDAAHKEIWTAWKLQEGLMAWRPSSAYPSSAGSVCRQAFVPRGATVIL